MKNRESIFSDKAEYYSKIFSNIKFIGFAISLVSILGFLLVYSFLYGYYFSGSIESKISSFNIISNFIPFDIRTLTMTSFYFICIFYIIFGFISLLSEDKKNKKKTIVIFLLLAIIITIMLSLFFASDLTVKSIASFSLIWVYLGFIVWSFFLVANIILKTRIVIKGSVVTLFVWIILIKVLSYLPLEYILLQQLMVLLFFIFWPIITTISILNENKKWLFFLTYLSGIGLPMFFISLLVNQMTDNINLSFWLVILASLLVSIAIYKIKKPYKSHEISIEITNNESNNNRTETVDDLDDKPIDLTEDTTEEINNKKGFLYNTLLKLFKIIVDKKENGKLFVGAVLLLIYVLTPQISMFCGKGIRTLNSSKTTQLEIFFVNQNSDREKVTANYYLDNNSVLFISNENWELEVIKPVNYHITPFGSGSRTR